MLPLPGPRCGWFNMCHVTWTFSPPSSECTRDGKPYFSTAFKNNESTVLLLLLLDADKYTGILEKPSILPWITILHLLDVIIIF
jgi:hypothetical protein